MNDIGNNIKFLRKKRSLTQGELAKKIGIKKSMIGSYEENRAIPKLSVIQDLAHYFDISIDRFVNMDLSEVNEDEPNGNTDIQGKGIRILTTLVNSENVEQGTIVPEKASAGYSGGFSDPDYIEKLPVFDIPIAELSNENTYRIFQITGDSMEPVKTGAYIICEYLLNWNEFREGKPHIVVTREDGIVYKRLFRGEGDTILLKSDNLYYEAYDIHFDQIMEIWKAVGYISFDLPGKDEVSVDKLHYIIQKLQKDVDLLKNNKQ